jgi:hypothetical protein
MTTKKFLALQFKKETGIDSATLALILGRSRVWVSNLLCGKLKDKNIVKLHLPSLSLISGIDLNILAKYALGNAEGSEITEMKEPVKQERAMLTNHRYTLERIAELEAKLSQIIGE